MEQLTLLLFQRMGILLMLTFILTRFPMFRQLLDREVSFKNAFYFSILFGVFGIAGTYAGIVVGENGSINPAFWIMRLNEYETVANLGLVGVVIGGLLGGPIVGLGAGLITGAHFYSLGGFAGPAAGLSAPIAGLIAGLIARFFAQERVISPFKALFIGMSAPILQMGTILIFSSPPDVAIAFVNTIGIPMVLTNSISIAIFTTMIHAALKEEERAATFETQRAIKIADLTLPHLKQGLTPDTAQITAQIFLKELRTPAVAVTNRSYVLAHAGAAVSHHMPGSELKTAISRKALETGRVQITFSHEDILCPEKNCPIHALIVIPFRQGKEVIGLIKLYFKRPQQIRTVEIALARGLSKLISNQLTMAMAEQMEHLMKEAELRVLQAQINPHFLFNTLNSVVSLIRSNPDLARHVTVQLSTFMRMNLKVTSTQLVPVYQEINHLNAYLDIIILRFADQLTVSSEIEPGLEHVLIPPATLQPLVENSIQHGLKTISNGGKIVIRLQKHEGGALITIEDNGSGIAPDALPLLGETPMTGEQGNGIGIYNVNQRLIRRFGPESKLRFNNKAAGGCQVSFLIPFDPSERTVDV
ncbi:LytS/YhcK type 5TM receptor domain-containing protein [Paenibacillus tarimensis]